MSNPVAVILYVQIYFAVMNAASTRLMGNNKNKIKTVDMDEADEVDRFCREKARILCIWILLPVSFYKS
jgi:hypothetical protein